MNPLRDLLQHSQKRLILDARAYAHKVLMQHKPYPWHDATLYSNYMKQVASLLKADALVLRFDKLLEEELQNNSALVAKMAEKSRSTYALKVFMADEELRAITSSLVNTATNTLHVHILTQLPSPLALLKMTAKAVGASQDFEDEHIENAGVYYADWLRSYKDSKVCGLLFDARAFSLSEELYQPIINTASSYGWMVGFREERALHFLGESDSIPVLDSDFWIDKSDGGACAGGACVNRVFFTEIHKDAVPEVVLEKLGAFGH
ncbi:hypothetical protein ACFOPX_00310 [Helicobacter baculiformis]|uniref:Uncharacterized protein n=1 Tax=Helicobacter baculiformis TaxID=427351 RepID=A0ABV7ZG49_9HELI|nr:hypothetical protein [Helicobacter baculiformis]